MNWKYQEQNRIGDHIWYVSDLGRFQSHHPEWRITYDVDRILEEIIAENRDRWLSAR
jgi:CDP-paratose 2-epimerase